jgi:hypothetical protein
VRNTALRSLQLGGNLLGAEAEAVFVSVLETSNMTLCELQGSYLSQTAYFVLTCYQGVSSKRADALIQRNVGIMRNRNLSVRLDMDFVLLLSSPSSSLPDMYFVLLLSSVFFFVFFFLGYFFCSIIVIIMMFILSSSTAARTPQPPHHHHTSTTTTTAKRGIILIILIFAFFLVGLPSFYHPLHSAAAQ